MKLKKSGKKKSVLIIAENEPQDVKLIKSKEEKDFGVNAIWNDDFHHTSRVALTAHKDAYYTDYKGSPQEFISAFKIGFLYQGQRYKWQNKRRRTSSIDIDPAKFVLYIQNHDQIANSACGLRIQKVTSPGKFKALSTLLLLAPGTPMIFQGRELLLQNPFLYFTDVCFICKTNLIFALV